jgi:oligosaccharyltransferase complex subunit beta
VIALRPFHHNEYERYIPQAYPYYAASFAVMGAWWLVAALFLYTKDETAKVKKN